MELNHLSSQIIKAAINVHTAIGPGLLESIYLQALAIELKEMGVKLRTEVPLAVYYRGRLLGGDGFRLDMLVDETIVVELKSVEEMKSVFQKQLLTYLRLAQKPLGLLINFNEPLLKDGITRIINSHKGESLPDFSAQKIGQKDVFSAPPRARANPPRG